MSDYLKSSTVVTFNDRKQWPSSYEQQVLRIQATEDIQMLSHVYNSYMCVYIHTYIHTHTYTYTYTHTHPHPRMHAYMHVQGHGTQLKDRYNLL